MVCIYKSGCNCWCAANSRDRVVRYAMFTNVLNLMILIIKTLIIIIIITTTIIRDNNNLLSHMLSDHHLLFEDAKQRVLKCPWYQRIIGLESANSV